MCQTTTFLFRAPIAALALSFAGSGCTVDDATTEASGNAELGIATFEVDDTASRTRVVGLDAEGNEVGRLDLIHGRFALTGMYKDDYPGEAEVVGRKLDVDILGQRRFTWETAGYEPVLHMPAHPPTEAKLAAFLDDPHVKAELDRWQIGFDPFQVDDSAFEVGYTTGSTSGTSPFGCSSPATNCGTTGRGYTMNTCGGGVPAARAARNQHTSPYNEYMVDQCCPSGSGGKAYDWFAIKACPNSGTASSCGTVGGTSACKACGEYPANSLSKCSMRMTSSAIDWCYAESGSAVASLSVSGTVSPAGTITTTIPNFSCTNGACIAARCPSGAASSIVLTRTDSYLDFSGFAGGCTSITNSCTLTSSNLVNITYYLRGTVSGALSGNGQMSRTTPASVLDTKNTSFTITMPTSDPGYTFTHDGVCTNFSWTSNSCTCSRTSAGQGTITLAFNGKTRVVNVAFN